MKRGFLGAICCLLLITAVAIPLSAQLAAPTAAGVSLGAVYYTVPDVAAHKKIWVDIFGAKPTMVGKTEMLKMPGVFIVLSQGTPSTATPLVNHLGIWAKDLNPTRAKLTAAGIQTAAGAQFVDLPITDLRLEFIDDPAGPEAPAAHHIHYFVASAEVGMDGRAWYVKTFGAAENSRRNGGVPSALLTAPDKWISIDFTAAGGGGRGGARRAWSRTRRSWWRTGCDTWRCTGSSACSTSPQLLQQRQRRRRPQRVLCPTRARSWIASRWK